MECTLPRRDLVGSARCAERTLERGVAGGKVGR